MQSSTNKLIMENGVSENNVHLYLSDIENRMKFIKKYFEDYEKARTGDYVRLIFNGRNQDMRRR